MIDEKLFRQAMGQFATGITVVTAKAGEKTKGMTVNAFMSVSLEPRLVTVAINKTASMYDLLMQSKTFGVSLLREDQQDMSQIFARQKEGESEVEFIEQEGAPVLKDALANIACKTVDRVEAGDHVLLIGEVTAATLHGGDPLIYFGSKYRTLQDK